MSSLGYPVATVEKRGYKQFLRNTGNRYLRKAITFERLHL